ncbi:CocE/NonD family hydrolase [Streptomyces sp. DSM 40750]|uniref:CocE/NonD family hydrolase n=1 Tax=Streptomyces sp. DSM 40750 TaxID=2801030 RepID=UPI00214AC278|nr:CocE/NonD family hydrolase [Streptomyces sp. DSM 40750]UUU26239.1 CocE/NonD family hydrolase [Streptomyces sp. DSM 40750]
MTEIQIELDVPAETRDGTVLRADGYRPGGTGPWPVLPARLPYGKQTPMMAAGLDPLAAASHGSMVVIQGTRGRFASEGGWEPFTYAESDGYDTVRWAAALPGSNGSVGMIGGSYFGNTQWMAALSKPPELKKTLRGGSAPGWISPALNLNAQHNALTRRNRHPRDSWVALRIWRAGAVRVDLGIVTERVRQGPPLAGPRHQANRASGCSSMRYRLSCAWTRAGRRTGAGTGLGT